MKPVELRRRTPLAAAEAWRRLTEWERHGGRIPLTEVRLLPGPPHGVGARFVARTSLGPVGFDDVMEVVTWQPPHDGDAEPRLEAGSSPETGAGCCRVEKRGRVLTGWAEISVVPSGLGSVVTWREAADVAWLGPLRAVPGQVVGRLLFGRLLDRLLADPA